MHHFSKIAFLASLLAPLTSNAQFTSGSDGSDGPLTVAALSIVTLDVPPDGIFNFTTVDLGDRCQVFFNRNASNTPIHILGTGKITLRGIVHLEGEARTNATIQGGLGGPGGFNGGAGHTTNPGDGLGPGGGKGGWGFLSINGPLPGGDEMRGGGSFASQSSSPDTLVTRGSIYGNTLLIPLAGGSGGGGGRGDVPTGGGGGGGAICFASDTEIDCIWNAGFQQPQIAAVGGNGQSSFGPGSGGAVRLVAPIVKGKGFLNVAPGNVTRGGYGRVRIDSNSPGQFEAHNGNDSDDYTTFGSNMVVFPPNPPTVRIVEAAGQVVADDRTDPVFVLLPTGAAEMQDIRVKVEDFGTVVPLRITVSPESGERTVHDFTIDNTAGGATEGTQSVPVPSGTTVRIDAWTR